MRKNAKIEKKTRTKLIEFTSLKKRAATSLEEKLREHAKNIGLERDRIRDLLDEYEGILADCDEASDALNDAVEALSKLL